MIRVGREFRRFDPAIFRGLRYCGPNFENNRAFLYDRSGYGAIGAPTGAGVDIVWDTTVQATAMTIDSAQTHYMSTPDSAALRVTGELTIMGWVYNTGTTAFAGLFQKWGVASASYSLGMGSGGTGVLAAISADGSSSFLVPSSAAGIAVTSSVWHHVALSYSPSKRATLYIDGENAAERTASVPASIHANASVLAFGRNVNASAQFGGRLAHPYVFARALGGAEIVPFYRDPWYGWRGKWTHSRLSFASITEVYKFHVDPGVGTRPRVVMI